MPARDGHGRSGEGLGRRTPTVHCAQRTAEATAWAQSTKGQAAGTQLWARQKAAWAQQAGLYGRARSVVVGSAVLAEGFAEGPAAASVGAGAPALSKPLSMDMGRLAARYMSCAAQAWSEVRSKCKTVVGATCSRAPRLQLATLLPEACAGTQTRQLWGSRCAA